MFSTCISSSQYVQTHCFSSVKSGVINSLLGILAMLRSILFHFLLLGFPSFPILWFPIFLDTYTLWFYTDRYELPYAFHFIVLKFWSLSVDIIVFFLYAPLAVLDYRILKGTSVGAINCIEQGLPCFVSKNITSSIQSRHNSLQVMPWSVLHYFIYQQGMWRMWRYTCFAMFYLYLSYLVCMAVFR